MSRYQGIEKGSQKRPITNGASKNSVQESFFQLVLFIKVEIKIFKSSFAVFEGSSSMDGEISLIIDVAVFLASSVNFQDRKSVV